MDHLIELSDRWPALVFFVALYLGFGWWECAASWVKRPLAVATALMAATIAATLVIWALDVCDRRLRLAPAVAWILALRLICVVTLKARRRERRWPLRAIGP